MYEFVSFLKANRARIVPRKIILTNSAKKCGNRCSVGTYARYAILHGRPSLLIPVYHVTLDYRGRGSATVVECPSGPVSGR